MLSPAAVRRAARAHAALVAAYRVGLGLAAVTVVRDAAGVRVAAAEIAADAGPSPAPDIAETWWCRRSADAERLVAAATARLRRCESCETAAAVEAAARRLAIAVFSDQDIGRAAEAVIARVDDEIATLRQAGELKTVNRAYRSYRIEAAACGDKALPYARWFDKYKQDLVRQLAETLRYG